MVYSRVLQMLRATWSGFCAFRPPLPSARQASRIEIEISRAPTRQDRSERRHTDRQNRLRRCSHSDRAAPAWPKDGRGDREIASR